MIIDDANTAAQAMQHGHGLKAVDPPLRISTLGLDESSLWDRYVEKHERATIFHTTAWRNAVSEAFPHEPHYLQAVQGGRVVGILPLFEVASRLAGRLLVSVPYAVAGGVLADNEIVAKALLNQAKQITEKRQCCMIDLRSEQASFDELPTVDRYVGFSRNLPGSPGEVLGWLPRKARAAARNARNKYRLTVSFGDEHLRDVWQLYAQSMRRLGSLTYPYRFFERLIFHTPGRHLISVVQKDGRSIAGLVTFLFRDRVMPYFLGTADRANRYHASNYIYLTLMERTVADGFVLFDFGRSRCDNRGSYDFKRLQGFQPEPLQYQYLLRAGEKRPQLSPDSSQYAVARKVWKYLPLWATKAASHVLSRHIPG